jgi:hypothetical protein
MTMGLIWHFAVAVPDIGAGMEEIGKAFGVSWRPVQVSQATLRDKAGVEHRMSVKWTFSEGGPPAIEMVEAIPGTPLDAPADSVLHHIGYWVDDLHTESVRLVESGWPLVASSDTVAIHLGPGGLMLEPCDVNRDRPTVRDLFPPGSPHFGPPVKAG